jgi:SAM-dependent methyltransferase
MRRISRGCPFVYDDAKGGVFCEEYYVTPGVAQIFRRQALIEFMDKFIEPQFTPPPVKCQYLEIGCGTGCFCFEAFRRGAEVYAHDLNPEVNRIVDEIYNSDKNRINVKPALTEGDYLNYDIVGAYEVLEHCEDDIATLREWRRYIRDDGILLLTVPARMKLWNFSDELGGHFRRYERKELTEKLAKTGFDVLSIECVGFPFTNIIRPITMVLVYKKRFAAHKNKSMHERTLISGIDKSVDYGYKSIVPWKLLRFCSIVQKLFWKQNWGYNYVVAARKTTDRALKRE